MTLAIDRWRADTGGRNWELVQRLGQDLTKGDVGINCLPRNLILVLQRKAWRSFRDPMGKPHEWGESEFAAFVTAEPMAGLGATVALVRKLLEAAPPGERDRGLDLLDQALQRPHGGRKSEELKIDNIQLDPAPTGTAQATALRRLRKDRPDLHARVLAGEVSAHAAMVAAGFRRRTISVPVDEPARMAATLRRHLTMQQLIELGAALVEQGENP